MGYVEADTGGHCRSTRRSSLMTRSTLISGLEPTGNGDEYLRLDWRGRRLARYVISKHPNRVAE